LHGVAATVENRNISGPRSAGKSYRNIPHFRLAEVSPKYNLEITALERGRDVLGIV
jgi:hypothetical protein